MSLAAPPDHLHSLSGLEGRRSTRIDRNVPLVVLGITRTGLSFQEKTSTVSFNLHGCRYPSRHEYPIGSSVGLRVLQADGETISPVIRAFVKSVHPPASPRELFQVGVELESPANIWNVPTPPPDWNRLLGGSAATANMASAAGTATAMEPQGQPHAAEPQEPSQQQASPPFASTPPAIAPSAGATNGETRTSQITEFPSPSPGAAGGQTGKEGSPAKPERVAITIDQLVAAMQGKLQAAAEKVVQNALAEHLDEAVDAALARVDGVRERNLQQLGEFSEQRLESLMRSSREEILGHLESRLGEVQSRWEEQHNAYRAQSEEIAQRLERLAADAERQLAATQKSIEKIGHEIEPKTRGRLDESLGQATEQFESAADRISDRQLVRV
ncbi:MAG TPA: hypothetical protein VGI46_10635, partial [Candidatus Acidoferrum sp.]